MFNLHFRWNIMVETLHLQSVTGKVCDSSIHPGKTRSVVLTTPSVSRVTMYALALSPGVEC